MSNNSTPIDETVSRAYKNLTSAQLTEFGIPVYHSSLSNLVAYTDNPTAARSASRALYDLQGYHPCRSILVEVGERRRVSIEYAEVCGISPRGERKLCGEIVKLGVPASSLDSPREDMRIDLLSWLLPLFVPEARVALWLPSLPHVWRAGINDLASKMNALLVDTSSLPATHSSQTLLDCALGMGEVVCDLGWLQLEEARADVADVFDRPANLETLDGADNVIFEFDAVKPSLVHLLLVAWFVERSGTSVARPMRWTDGLGNAIIRRNVSSVGLILRFGPNVRTSRLIVGSQNASVIVRLRLNGTGRGRNRSTARNLAGALDDPKADSTLISSLHVLRLLLEREEV